MNVVVMCALVAAVLFVSLRRPRSRAYYSRLLRNRRALAAGGVVATVDLAIIAGDGGGLAGVVPALLLGLIVAAVVNRARPVTGERG